MSIGILMATGCSLVGGAFDKEPNEISQLSSSAKALVNKAFNDVDAEKLRDYHTHIIGLDPDSTGTFVNENWQSILHPVSYLKFLIYLSAADITDRTKVDSQYLDRLNKLIHHMPKKGRFGIMAFDYFHNENGLADKTLTTFRVPNDYVINIARSNPERYFPIISIHPYRDDAVKKLETYAKQGIRFVKWLPNAMGINPASEKPGLKKKLESYYRIMQQYDMVLITHTGDEKATEAEEYQHFGNPLYLRKPLSMGVKVVMAHVASLGKCRPIESSLCQPGTAYIDLALNMMRKEKHKALLFADISALTQFNRKESLDKVLAARDIHANLVNGSDYPLPAVNFVIQTRSLVNSGHITTEERKSLNEIYNVNPLLFDYVLKRTIQHSKTGQKFHPGIFMRNEKL